MGLRDRRTALLEDKAAEQEARSAARGEVAGAYVAEVNRGDINMTAYTERLNTMWHKGYRLHTAFEKDGNTVTIFERKG